MTATPFLDPAALALSLGDHAPRVAVRLFDEIDSTNTEARRHAEEAGTTLCIARTQTGGRGRMGRSFHSPADTGLYMTLAFTTARPADEVARVTPAAAVAAAEAIEALTGISPRIKWVNDLYLGGGKLAGILTEAVPCADGQTRVLVGIGVNLTTTSFPDGLRAPAASLFSPAEAHRATPALVGTLAGEMTRRLLCAVETPTDTAILAAYRARLLFVGERVTVTRGNDTFPATLRGVEEDYSLLVERDGEILALGSGEISVRPAQ